MSARVPTSRTAHWSLLMVGTAALALSGCQTKPKPAPEPEPAGEIVVTGSNARTPQLDAPSSVTVVSAEALPPAPSPAPQISPMHAASVRYRTTPYMPQTPNTERYEGENVSSIKAVAQEPVSTFSVDVDTGSYANVRRFLNQGTLPPEGAARTEELINYFRYDYPLPSSRETPFSVTTNVTRTPWNPETRLLRVGLRGYDIAYRDRPPANLVFLVDVSGSMNSADKLPLVKSALGMVADRMRPNDKVSIVVYAGAAGVVLEPTSNASDVRAALDRLNAGGSTAGGAGLRLAYDTARKHLRRDGINRILLATDGDFNVGITDQKELEALVTRNRDDGITLTTLGFGQGNYNEALMESIADLGNGNYSYIDSATEARKVLDEELSSTLFTIAKDVKIQIEFNPAHVREYRLVGYENRLLAEEDFNNDKVDAGDIGASHQVTAIYEIVPAGATGWLADRRYDGNRPTGKTPSAGSNELAFLKLRYKMPNGTTSRLIERPIPVADMRTASAPTGDMAFAVAVAAFGQRLRGDKYLNGYGYSDIRALAGEPSVFTRQEFVRLVDIARSLDKR